ncbi:MAG: hypothetical protein ABSH29_20610 [Acidimicrobiales bacterium]|jgi:hypothetical protein
MDPSTRNLRKWLRDLGDLGVQTVHFAGALGGSREESNRLLVVGTPEFEPWHFVAHMSEEAERQGRSDLRPTLMRWEIPAGAPAHLAVSVDDIAHATRNQTVLVVPSRTRSWEMLERVSDAKRRGARIMSVHRGDDDLADLSHEMLSVDPRRADHDYDVTQHIVTDVAPGHALRAQARWRLRRSP